MQRQTPADLLSEWSGIDEDSIEVKDVPVSFRIQPADANATQTLQALYNQSRSEVLRAAVHVGLSSLMAEHSARNPDCRVGLYDPAVAAQTKARYEEFGADAPCLPTTLAEWEASEEGWEPVDPEARS